MGGLQFDVSCHIGIVPVRVLMGASDDCSCLVERQDCDCGSRTRTRATIEVL